jgi:hypothetical protein
LLRPQRGIDRGGLVVADQPFSECAVDGLDRRIDGRWARSCARNHVRTRPLVVAGRVPKYPMSVGPVLIAGLQRLLSVAFARGNPSLAANSVIGP